MPGVRMSGLPIAKFCGSAAALNVGSGRAAAMSSAFHAVCSNAPNRDALLAKLSQVEREEIAEWHRPADVEVAGHVLRYDDAETELEVAITETAGYCTADDPRAISVGHLDMAWAVEFVLPQPDGTHRTRKVVYVGDIKRTQWTTLDGPDSLQLVAYAFAYGAKHQADAYCCGIWQATEGQWHWGELVDFDSDTAAKAWDDVYHAARNTSSDYAMGPHCSGCWARFRCPAYLLPPEMLETSLAPLTGEVPRTNERMLQLLQLKKRGEDTLKLMDKELKEWALHHGGIDDGNGKSWRAVECQGRESFDSKAAIAEHPEMAAYLKQGAPFQQYRWVKT